MTHVLQALDQTFGAVKKNMQRRIHHWHGENPGKRLDQYTLMKLVAYQAFEETYSNKEIVKKAFKKTGIYPWNKIQPDVRKLAAGSIYKRTFVHEEYFPFPPGCSGPSDTVALLQPLLIIPLLQQRPLEILSQLQLPLLITSQLFCLLLLLLTTLSLSLRLLSLLTMLTLSHQHHQHLHLMQC